MNIVEWRFGNVLTTCGFAGVAIGLIALFITSNPLFNIPIGLGMVLIFLRQLVM